MKGSTFSNDLLKLLFQATAIANLADNAATSPLTSLYLALHTADPGAGGSQITSESAYTGYARAAVARSTAGFTVTGNAVTLAATTAFPAATAGNESAMFWSVGTAVSGAGKILYSGPIGSALGPFTAVAATDTITLPGLTGISVNDRIAFYAEAGSALPTGLTAGTVYFVKTAAANDITISTTAGGATVDLTTAGDGVAYKVSPISISSGVTPRLTTGTTITET